MFISITDHIELDKERRIVRIDSKEISLTGMEFGLVEYLATHPNKICSKRELIDNVWGNRFQYDPGTIDVHLNAIRRKTGWSKSRPIETIRGIGLVFRIEQNNDLHTVDLHAFTAEWIQRHAVELNAKHITPYIKLSPFVNDLSITAETLSRLLDAVLGTFLPTAQPGTLIISSKLTIHTFTLSLDLNGTISEFSIPINRDFEGT